jgi:hypothetical protein
VHRLQRDQLQQPQIKNDGRQVGFDQILQKMPKTRKTQRIKEITGAGKRRLCISWRWQRNPYLV